MPPGALRSNVEEASAWLKSRGVGSPRLAVVMGSGLAGALQIPDPRLSVGFSDIPGFGRPSVAGHPGRLVSGRLHGLDLALFEGRIHMYEGSGLETLRLAAGVMAGIGVRVVLLTSACGGLSATLRPGDLVVVWDHLVYPLGGQASGLGMGGGSPDLDGMGPLCSRRATGALETACLESRARWRRGVLAFSAGPCYESPAEARLLRDAGADVVSMSAAAEAKAAAREGLKTACLCCVTNMVGLRADHGEVLKAAAGSRRTLSAVLDRFVSLAARGGWVD
jgi:purine-nucleoside phosphorylase